MDKKLKAKGHPKLNSPVKDETQQEEKKRLGLTDLPLEVQEKIFGYFPLSDLLSCRLVHRSWISGVTKPCRKITETFQVNTYHTADNAKKMKSLVKWIGQDFPFAKFQFDVNNMNWGEFNEYKNLSSADVNHILRTISSFATDFTLKVSLPTRLPHIPRYFNKTFKFDKMKQLHLEVSDGYVQVPLLKYDSDEEKCRVRWDNGDRKLFNFVGEIINNGTVLQEVTLQINPHRDLPDKSIIPRYIEDFGFKSSPTLLTTLILYSKAENVDWEVMQRIGLKLKNVSLVMPQLPGHKGQLLGFLESQSESLESLTASFYIFDKNHRPLILPSLKTLKSFPTNIPDRLGLLINHLISSISDISYPTQFPALKILDLFHCESLLLETFIKPNMQPLSTLEELNLPKDTGDDVAIIQAALIFPKIKKLSFGVHPRVTTMDAVYQHKYLEELTLNTFDPWIDEFVTGLNFTAFYSVQGPRSAKEAIWSGLLQRSSHKSLASLKNLRILRIYQNQFELLDEFKRLEFTEISVLVMKQIGTLECVDLGYRKPKANGMGVLDDLKQHCAVIYRTSR